MTKWEQTTPSESFLGKQQSSTSLPWSFALTAIGLAALSCSAAMAQDPSPKSEMVVESAAAPAAKSSKLDFDKTGPQVGDQLPALTLRTIKGEPQRLDDAWRGGPALLVTSSLTCPKSRSRWPELQKIVEKYGDKLNVVIVYVIEAHPVGSICPYKGIEDITPENEADGILRRQPDSLEDRLELAQEFKRYLRINTPIYIDNMRNEAWKAVGAAPNLALLVNDEGIVVARNGWFEGEATDAAIETYLKDPNRSRSARKYIDTRSENRVVRAAMLAKVGLEQFDFQGLIEAQDGTQLAAVLKKNPELANCVFENLRGNESTALMYAIQRGNSNSVELLLSHGADVHAKSADETALQLAARNGELKIAKLLLKHGANASVPPSGKSPLHEASLAGHHDLVRLLLSANAQPDIYSTIALGDSETVQKLLAADPSLAARPDGAQRMPLDYAAANGRLEIAKALISSGAPVVEAKLIDLEPPLHRAIARKDHAMVELLLGAGSSPDTAVGFRGENSRSTPALHSAVRQGELTIIRSLLAHGANVEARDTFSETALHVAAELGRADIVKRLLEAGAEVNVLKLGFHLPCGSGDESKPTNNTPLHLAAVAGNPETIKALLAAGAELNARTADGTTPLMATIVPPRYSGSSDDPRLPCAECLIKAGADINARNDQGQTALDLALAALKQNEDEFDARPKDDVQKIAALLNQQGAKRGEQLARKAVREF